MKSFYYEFFHIPEQGKIRDKVLTARVVLTAVLIIVYMLAMSLSAYAFYTVGLTHHSTIQTAHFAAQMELLDGSGNLVDYETRDGVYYAELQPDFYTVRLSYGGDAETGFCVLQLNEKQYHTRQFFAENWASDELVLMLEIYEPSELTVVPNWGTSSCYETFRENGDVEEYLIDGETLTVGAPPEEETEEETDLPEETEDLSDFEDEAEEYLEDTEEFAEEQEEETDPLEDTVDLVQQAEQADPLA